MFHRCDITAKPYIPENILVLHIRRYVRDTFEAHRAALISTITQLLKKGLIFFYPLHFIFIKY